GVEDPRLHCAICLARGKASHTPACSRKHEIDLPPRPSNLGASYVFRCGLWGRRDGSSRLPTPCKHAYPLSFKRSVHSFPDVRLLPSKCLFVACDKPR